jgi:hypothetical protein
MGYKGTATAQGFRKEREKLMQWLDQLRSKASLD